MNGRQCVKFKSFGFNSRRARMNLEHVKTNKLRTDFPIFIVIEHVHIRFNPLIFTPDEIKSNRMRQVGMHLRFVCFSLEVEMYRDKDSLNSFAIYFIGQFMVIGSSVPEQLIKINEAISLNVDRIN